MNHSPKKDGGAGIGSGAEGSVESIHIDSSAEATGSLAITAQGGDGAAGIGGGGTLGGANASVQEITIGKASITATGGKEGAAIGAGYGTLIKQIAINGESYITANSGSEATAIGSGNAGSCASISFFGKTDITANANSSFVAIGEATSRTAPLGTISGDVLIKATTQSSTLDPLAQMSIACGFLQTKNASGDWKAYFGGIGDLTFDFWENYKVEAPFIIPSNFSVTNSNTLELPKNGVEIDGKFINKGNMVSNSTDVPSFVCKDNGVVSVLCVFDALDGFIGTSSDHKITINVPYQTAQGLQNYASTLPSVTPSEGETFLNWQTLETDPSVKATVISSDTQVLLNRQAIVANYDYLSYQVTFNTDGGSSVPPQTVRHDECAERPADPTKEWYEFQDWYSDAKLTTIYNFDTPVKQDLTLYAKWTPISCVVNFIVNGGTDVPSTTAPYNTKISAPDQPTKTHYTFGGWYKDVACTQQWDFANDVVKSNPLLLYAKWNPLSYTVKFDTQGADSPTPTDQTVEYKNKVQEPTKPTKSGYHFDGWWTTPTADAGTEWFFDTSVVEDNMTLYAKWNLTPTYVVTFNSNGGSKVDDQHVIEGEYAEKPTDPTKDFMDFSGWFSDEALTKLFDFDTVPIMSNTTLYAKWTPVTCTVNFESNGGTSVDSVSKPFGSLIPEPAQPTKDFYTFSGWYKDAACTDEWNFSVDVISALTMTLYAKWTGVDCTVSFDTVGGSVIGDVTVPYGELLKEPEKPTKEHFDFSGWFTDSSYSDKWDFSKDKVEQTAMTLYAKWTGVNCTVSFDSQGGSAVASQSVAFNTPLIKPSDPVKRNFTFAGWYIEKECENQWNFDSPVLENMTLYAKWDAIPGDTCVVRFDTQGGSDVETQTVPVGSTLVKPTDPVFAGYTFAGWFKDPQCSVKWNFEEDVAPEGVLYLFACWNPISLTVTFETSGGGIIQPQTVKYDSFLKEPEVPTKDQFVFSGWYTEESLTNMFIFNQTRVTASMKLYAKWTPANAYFISVNQSDHAQMYVSEGYSGLTAGTLVHFLVSPDLCWGLSQIPHVTTMDGSNVEVTALGKNEFSFVMPEQNVTINSNIISVQFRFDSDSFSYTGSDIKPTGFSLELNGSQINYCIEGYKNNKLMGEKAEVLVSNLSDDSSINGAFLYRGSFDIGQWYIVHGDYAYQMGNGEIAKGMKIIDSKTYYFDGDGDMATGFVFIDGKEYYFDDTGALVKKEWIVVNGNTYRTDNTGAILKGHNYVDGVLYIFDATGIMQKGWAIEGGAKYWCGDDGHVAQNKWFCVDNAWYRANNTGEILTGQNYVDGHLYIFDSNGIMRTGWILDGNVWYWCNESGQAAQNGWYWVTDAWYYFNSNGSMQPVGWFWDYDSSAWYYISDTGRMQVGWIWTGAWYYCKSNGTMVKGIWDWIDNEWYGFNWDGTMCTGWIWDYGYHAWFYCQPNGVLLRNGVYYLDGTLYRFDDSGRWY